MSGVNVLQKTLDVFVVGVLKYNADLESPQEWDNVFVDTLISPQQEVEVAFFSSLERNNEAQHVDSYSGMKNVLAPLSIRNTRTRVPMLFSWCCKLS
jgi:hypothetical protein